jgi:hypothetical protein
MLNKTIRIPARLILVALSLPVPRLMGTYNTLHIHLQGYFVLVASTSKGDNMDKIAFLNSTLETTYTATVIYWLPLEGVSDAEDVHASTKAELDIKVQQLIDELGGKCRVEYH